MMRALRVLMVIDAAVLFLLGVVLMFVPNQLALAFHFQSLPEGVNYIVGLWGCALLTMAPGYVVASQNPIRHAVWVQVGIARGALECLLGLLYLARGIVTFQQAGFGIVLAGLLATAYIILYPRTEPLPRDTAPPAAPASPV